MKNYVISLMLLLVVSFGFCQTFDPITGEVVSDSVAVMQFDPETGLPIKSSPIILEQKNFTSAQIVARAKFDSKQNFYAPPWNLVGVPIPGVSLIVGGLTATVFDGVLDLAGVGFIFGAGATAFGLPKSLSKLPSGVEVRTILSVEQMYPEFNDRKTYWDAYQKHNEKLRLGSIYKGELYTVGGFFGIIILGSILF